MLWLHHKITEEEKHEENKITTLFTLIFYWRAHYPSTKRVHYWVEEFAYRPEINTTKVLANDSTEKVSVSVDKTKIKQVDVTFDQDSYSLQIGQNTTPEIKIEKLAYPKAGTSYVRI